MGSTMMAPVVLAVHMLWIAFAALSCKCKGIPLSVSLCAVGWGEGGFL